MKGSGLPATRRRQGRAAPSARPRAAPDRRVGASPAWPILRLPWSPGAPGGPEARRPRRTPIQPSRASMLLSNSNEQHVSPGDDVREPAALSHVNRLEVRLAFAGQEQQRAVLDEDAG